MALTLNGTTGIAGIAGSAGTPALQGNNDTNTGYFFAADTLGLSTAGTERLRITSAGALQLADTNSPNDKNTDIWVADDVLNFNAFGTNGAFIFKSGSSSTERVRIDSSGRLLIGTTTEGASTYAETLTIAGTTHCGMTIRSATNGVGSIYFSDGTSGNSEYRGYFEYNHTNDFLLFATGATERLRIDSSGRVLIGTTTEGEGTADNLTVAGSGHEGITIRSGTSHFGSLFFSDGTSGTDEYKGSVEYNHNGDYLYLRTAATERLRITSTGQVYFPGTGAGSGSRGLEIATESVGAADEGVIFNARASGTTGRLTFKTNSATAMTILGNGGNVGIGTTSPGCLLEVNTADNSDNHAIANFSGTDVGNAASFFMRYYACGSDDNRTGFYWQHENVANVRMWMGDDAKLRSKTSNPSSGNDGNAFVQEGISANNIKMNNGEGIDFSATGGPSSGSGSSELFDDYEQGTFTPGIGGSSGNPTYTASQESGKYIKIGNQVHVEILIIITNVAAQGSGNWKITNMPYTFGGTSYASIGIIGYNDIFATEVHKVYIAGSHLTVIPNGVTQSNQTFAQNAFSTGYFSVTIDYLSS